MDTWLITRYLLARFQQLRELLSGLRTAKPVKDLPLLAEVVRDNWLRAVVSIEILWLRCVLGLPDTKWTKRLKVSTVLKRATRLQVASHGTLGVGTPGGRG
jgi:hypothetical protein